MIRPAATPVVEPEARSEATMRRDRIMQAIHEAAILEFSQNGLKGASTQDIAERAGLSKPQLHYYIESKEALYEEVLGGICSAWGEIFISASAETDHATAIAGFVRRKLEFSFDHPAAARLFAKEVMSGAEYLKPWWRRWQRRRLQGLDSIERWMREGRIAAGDPLMLLFHIWGVTQHYADYEMQVRFLKGLGDKAPLPREQIIAEVTGFVLRACGLSALPLTGPAKL